MQVLWRALPRRAAGLRRASCATKRGGRWGALAVAGGGGAVAAATIAVDAGGPPRPTVQLESRSAGASGGPRIVIVGAGVMGSSIAWALAKEMRGGQITVLEGGWPRSSWGSSRIARLSYSDDALLRLAQRSFELFDDLQGTTSETILHKVPCVDFGDAEYEALGMKLGGLMKAYDKQNLPYAAGYVDGEGNFIAHHSANGASSAEALRRLVHPKAGEREAGAPAAACLEEMRRMVPRGVTVKQEGQPTGAPEAPLALRPNQDVCLLQPNGAAVMAANVMQALEDAFQALNGKSGARCEWVSPVKAVRVDRARKVVVVEDHHDEAHVEINEIPYDIVVLATGAYTNRILRDSGCRLLPLIPSNEQSLWYRAPGCSTKDGFPVLVRHNSNLENFLQAERLLPEGSPERLAAQQGYPKTREEEREVGNCGIYMVPELSDGAEPGLKIGQHKNGELLENDDEFVISEEARKLLFRTPNTNKSFAKERGDEVHLLPRLQCEEVLRQLVPSARVDEGITAHIRCMYTHTTLPRPGFIIGSLEPGAKDMYVCAGFQGEGFKFSLGIGEFMARRLMRDNGLLPEGAEGEKMYFDCWTQMFSQHHWAGAQAQP